MSCRCSRLQIAVLTVVAAAVLLFVPSPARASELARCATQDAWQRLDGRDFVLYTNASPREAAAAARRLDRFARLFAYHQPLLRGANQRRVVVFGMAGDSCYDAFGLRFDGTKVESDGVCTEGPDGMHFQFRHSGSDQDKHTMQHEYMHALSSERMRGAPSAVKEGLADFYGTVEFDSAVVTLGQAIPGYVRTLRSVRPMPLARLFGIGQDYDYFLGAERALFYAQSWAFVHALASTDQMDGLMHFVELFRRGTPPDLAFITAFPSEDWGRKPIELFHYVWQEKLTDFLIRTEGLTLEGPIEKRPVSRGEILSALGDVLLRQRRTRPEEAEAYYVAALGEQPGRGSALAGLGVIATARGDTKGAIDFHDRAARDSTNDLVTWWRIADGYLREAYRDTAGLIAGEPEPLSLCRKAATAARRALALGADDVDSACALAVAVGSDSASTAAAVDELMTLHLRMPSAIDLATALVAGLAESGRVEEAEAIIERAFGSDRTSPQARYCRRMVLYAGRFLVRELLDAGEVDVALDELVRLRDSTTETELRKYFADSIARVEADREKASEVERYDEGMRLANAGKLAEAIAIFDTLGTHASDPELLLKARDTADRLRSELAKNRKAGAAR